MDDSALWVDEVDEDDNICAEESVLFDSGDCDDCVHDVAALDSSFLFNRIDQCSAEDNRDDDGGEEDVGADNNGGDNATESEVF